MLFEIYGWSQKPSLQNYCHLWVKSIICGLRQCLTEQRPNGSQGVGRRFLFHLLASSKMSGSSLASFSRATSAMGPKMTTGLRNPAAQESKGHTLWMFKSDLFLSGRAPVCLCIGSTIHQRCLGLKNHCFARPLLTFPQHDSFVGGELGLDRLRWQILPALPQVPLGAAQPSEPPEVGSVSAGGLGEGVLHAGQLLGSGRKTGNSGGSNVASKQKSFSSTVFNLLPRLGSSRQGGEQSTTTQNPTIFLFYPTSLQHRLCGLHLVFLTLNNDVLPLMSVFGQNIIEVWMWFSRFGVFERVSTERGEGGEESDLAMMCLTSLNVFRGDTGTACGEVFLLVGEKKEAGVWKIKKHRREALKVAETDLDHPGYQTATQTCTTSPYKDRMCIIWPSWE